METKSNNASAAPGAAEATAEAITIDTVRAYVKRDLSVAISFLNAIHSDPDLIENVSQFMLGRWQNSLHKPKDN